MYEVIFLWAMALVFIFFSVVQDLKTREIYNWISFALIIFALGFRFFYSLSQENFTFFYTGLIGLGIFFLLGNILYYSKVFAGGDAKMMIALGTILPYYPDMMSNLQVFINFILIFLSVGFIYILAISTFLCIKHMNSFKKDFTKQFKQKKILMFVLLFFSIAFLALGFIQIFFAFFGVLIFLASYIYLYSKAVDEACMVRRISTDKLREGDWLYTDVKVGKHVIKATWDGLNKKDILEIAKRYKEIRIREGVPFSPVFIISFIIFAILSLFSINLWNPFW
jgi:Flp pilus assembly protein protease CpaA